jgi:diaminopimelate epimerase
MTQFTKAHAYGNDFLYVAASAVERRSLSALALQMCDRHTGVGADGLIAYDRTADGAAMSLWNADGGAAEVSGNGLRGLAALLLRDTSQAEATVTVQTAAGPKRLERLDRDGTRQLFRSAMGRPTELAQSTLMAAGESLQIVALNMGNPQCVLLGPLPDDERFRRLGPALEHHSRFPDRTNVEFAHVEAPDRVRILIWERGCGSTSSSGTGSCAALVAAAAYGGAARDAEVVAPGGAQRVEWRDEGVFLTGWVELVCDGIWLR